jgi:hypothetical protein
MPALPWTTISPPDRAREYTFWTVSAWDSRDALDAFSRDRGAHRRFTLITPRLEENGASLNAAGW